MGGLGREEVALLSALSIWGIGKLSPLELPGTGARWTCSGVSKSQIGKAGVRKGLFPRRKVVV